MLSNEAIEQRFQAIDGVQYVKVEGDGYKYHLTLVSDVFQGKSRVARQQWVYKHINELITSGQLHALSMSTYTNEEWESQNG